MNLWHAVEGSPYPLGATWVAEESAYMINGSTEERVFAIQQPQVPWRRSIDTAMAAPGDILEPGTEPTVGSTAYTVSARAIVVLIGPALPGAAR